MLWDFYRAPCPKFEYLPVKIKPKFLQGKNKFATFLNWLWNCFSFRIFFLACLQYLQTLCLVRNSRIPNLGHATMYVKYLILGIMGSPRWEITSSQNIYCTVALKALQGDLLYMAVCFWCLVKSVQCMGVQKCTLDKWLFTGCQKNTAMFSWSVWIFKVTSGSEVMFITRKSVVRKSCS